MEEMEEAESKPHSSSKEGSLEKWQQMNLIQFFIQQEEATTTGASGIQRSVYFMKIWTKLKQFVKVSRQSWNCRKIKSPAWRSGSFSVPCSVSRYSRWNLWAGRRRFQSTCPSGGCARFSTFSSVAWKFFLSPIANTRRTWIQYSISILYWLHLQTHLSSGNWASCCNSSW